MVASSSRPLPKVAGVYEPQDDSYLVERVISTYRGKKALDVGTGSGILARQLVSNFEQVVAVDVNPAAIEYARSHSIPSIQFFVSDLFQNVHDKFDLIVFNPPYLPGSDGDIATSCGNGDIYRRFFREAANYLEPDGKVVFLISSLSPIDVNEISKLGWELTQLERLQLMFEILLVFEARPIKK